jgi:HSP20 family protein
VTDLFQQGAADLADEARKLLDEIDSHLPGAASMTADCRPPLDVIETPTSVDIVLDVPGVPAEQLRVVIRRSTLLVVGNKPNDLTALKGRFHVAERSYGRFARVVRLNGAFDASRARAVVRAGELRVSLPVLEDRRGGVLAIRVERA